MLRILTEQEVSVVARALSLARKQFLAHADVMHQCAATGGNEMISIEAAQAMMDDHNRTAEEFGELWGLFERTEEVRLVGIEEESED